VARHAQLEKIIAHDYGPTPFIQKAPCSKARVGTKPFRFPKYFMQISEFAVRAALARFIENLARFAKSFYFLAT
jgi:hypothetical protein